MKNLRLIIVIASAFVVTACFPHRYGSYGGYRPNGYSHYGNPYNRYGGGYRQPYYGNQNRYGNYGYQRYGGYPPGYSYRPTFPRHR